MEEIKQALESEHKDSMEEVLKKVEDKVKVKPKAEPEVKPEVKSEEKPEVKPEVKSEEKPVEKPVEKPKESPTIGEVLKNEKKEFRTVPEATFLEMKKDNKELRKEMVDLKTLIEEGGSKQQVSESLEKIAEEHNVDVNLLDKLSKNIKREIEADYSAKIKPLEEKEKSDNIDKILNDQFDKTLVAMPEYKDIASREVIKSLALLEDNADKTIPQILEQSYGHLVQGKKTIDSGSPARSTTGEIEEIDFKKAETDGEYLKKVLDNPKTKKEYNDFMMKNQQF